MTKTKSSNKLPVAVYKEPKRVSIQRAANGYVISTYGEHGESVEVAKTIKEANQVAKRILEG